MPNQNEIIVLDLNDGNIDKFAKDMPNHGKVFIAFLADWCGHCQNFKPEWEKIKSHLKENPDGSGHVVTVNDKHMQKLPGKQPSGFPTMSLYNGKDHIKDYDKGRNMPEVLQFIKEHLGKQKHHKKHRAKHHTKHHKKRKRKHATHKKHKKHNKHGRSSNRKRKRRLIFDSPITMAQTDMFYSGGKRKRSKKRSRNKRKRKRKRQRTKRRRRSRRR
jgi:thiol-disulfide isomerase/thioredoxin